jgi:5'-deoxynucleotidase YfbR-like HD superfamily hydrolase
MGEFINIAFSPILRMKEVERYSGVYQIDRETLSDHISDVCIMSYLIAKKLIRDFGEKIDIGSLLEKCIIHDMDEVLTGDVPRNTKYANSRIKSSMDEVATQSIKSLADDLNYDDLVDKWKNSKKGKEGLILKITDMLDVAKKVISEIEFHNNLSFLKVVKELSHHLNQMQIALNEEHYKKDIGFTEDGSEWLYLVVSDASREIEAISDKYKSTIDRYKISENVLEATELVK